MSRRKILVADLLCGAGGSSTGCARAMAGLGLEMELVCVNHWQTAIDTHKLNHPEARHYVQDIAAVRPHLVVPEGYLDLLMASPTCTHHSVARGGKPTSDQQRSDPWHIVTWLTELRVKRLIVENVWEFTGWGPVDPRTGRPIPSKKGVYFDAWIDTLRRLGFEPEWRKLNAANYGEATTRQRFILKARNDRRRVGWAPITHAKRPPEGATLLPGLETWTPARVIIDFRIRGKSIFSRKKALAPKTLARIYAGALKLDWPRPFLVILRNHMAAQGIDVPLPSITGGGTHVGLADPVLVKQNFRRDVQGVSDPVPTIMTVARVGLAEPVVINGRKNSQAKGVETDPLPTLDTKGGVWLAEPFVCGNRTNNIAKPVEQPIGGITTTTGGGQFLVEPFVAGLAHSGSDECRCKGLDEPLGALHAGGGDFGIVEPFVLSQGAGGVARPLGEPLPTIPGGGAHALISPYYNNGWQLESGAPPPVYTVEDPLPPVTTRGRFGMVLPVTHVDGSSRARDAETDPLPTITTAKRGELAFITAQHGERPGQAPRVHSIDDPAPTVAATGHVDLVEGIVVDGVRYDILFRMLEPHELAAAMGFDEYAFAGTKTQQIKQIGNAVSVKMMATEVRAIMADAAPRGRARPPAARAAA